MKHSRLLAVLCASIVFLSLSQSAFAYYHPTAGRWLQRDPVGYRAGTNLVQYVNDNPAARPDPFGLYAPSALVDHYPEMPANLSETSWTSWPPFETNCRPGEKCAELALSFYWDQIRLWGGHVAKRLQREVESDKSFLSNLKGSGLVIGAKNVEEILYYSNLQVHKPSCACLKTLSIFAHGGYSGGFRMTADENTDQYVSRIGGTESFDNVRAFGRIIKALMCKPCFINLMACRSAEGLSAAFLAAESGCAVTGAKGWFWADPSGKWDIAEPNPDPDHADTPGPPGSTRTFYSDGSHTISGGEASGVAVFTPVPERTIKD